jgi:hypothetical protein
VRVWTKRVWYKCPQRLRNTMYCRSTRRRLWICDHTPAGEYAQLWRAVSTAMIVRGCNTVRK